MTKEELARRHAVWEALSDVFLDTETRWFFAAIARVLAESGYDEANLERIWRAEVVPEFGANLLDLVGEWGALPVDDERLAARAEGRRRDGRLLGATVGRAIDDQWRAILALRARLLARPPESWGALVDAWTAFAHAYLEASLDEVLAPERFVEKLRATGLGVAALLADFEGEWRPLYRELLTEQERTSEERRASNVRALVARTSEGPT